MAIEELADMLLLKEDLKEFDITKDRHFSGIFIRLNICRKDSIEPIKNMIYSDETSKSHNDLLTKFRTQICKDHNITTSGGGYISISQELLVITGQSIKFGKYDEISTRIAEEYRIKQKIKCKESY